MPVVNFHLVEGYCSHDQEVRLLKEASRLYSEVLLSPLERVRAMITVHSADRFAVAGECVSLNGIHAPYFEFIVFEGRPLDERQKLMTEFTSLLVDTLAVDRNVVRGRCIRVEPQDWSIGGIGADVLREQEICARAAKLDVVG